jgi:hypothetical protein
MCCWRRRRECPILPQHIGGALLQEAQQLQFSAWLETDSRGSHRCLPMCSSRSGPTIQRRRQHFLVNETLALEGGAGGVWIPKSPCFVYHLRLDDVAGRFQRGALAPTWPEAATEAQLCISAIHSPQQQAKGCLCPSGECWVCPTVPPKAQVSSGPHPEDPSGNSQRS